MFFVTGSQHRRTPANKMTSSSSSSSAAAAGVAVVGVANDDHAQLFTSCPVFVRKPQSASVFEGDPVKFTCQVQGHPKPRVHWEKDGKPVEMTSDSHLKVKLSALHLHNFSGGSNCLYIGWNDIAFRDWLEIVASFCASAIVEKGCRSRRHSVFGSVRLWVSACMSLCVPKTLWTPYLNKCLANAKRPCDCRVMSTWRNSKSAGKRRE